MIERDIEYLQAAKKYLADVPGRFAEHIRQVHNGIPATTCHRCLVFRQGIRSNTRVLQDLESRADLIPGI